MQTINDRIESIVNKDFGGNKTAFAKAVGLIPAAMSSYLGKQRRSKPSIDMVTKIVTNLNVDPLWLLTGESCASKKIQTSGDYSPASDSGDVKVIVRDSANSERVKMLEELLEEKKKYITLLETILKQNGLLND